MRFLLLRSARDGAYAGEPELLSHCALSLDHKCIDQYFGVESSRRLFSGRSATLEPQPNILCNLPRDCIWPALWHRFLGAIWLVLWAGALLWPFISSGIAPLISRPKFLTMLASFYVFSAALSLLIAGILLLSKKFATEFAYERKHLPRYKTFLKWSFGGVAILSIIIASFKDILHAAH